MELGTRDLRVVSSPARDVLESARIAVAVTAHGVRRDLTRCLASVAGQRIDLGHVVVVVLVDQVGGGPTGLAMPGSLAERTIVLTANCGSPARARNAALEYIDLHLPACRWVARLDSDDRFADRDSLVAAADAGDRYDALYVVGGNRVLASTGELLRVNSAGAWMRGPASVLDRLRGMADGTAENELPSCNLLLAARSGLRYPDTSSAEDHWLVASLLIHEPGRGALSDGTLFADYTLDGAVTREARRLGRHHRARVALHAAAEAWIEALAAPGRVLGFGQEGVVRRNDGRVVKSFYPGVLGPETAEWLARSLEGPAGIVPSAEIRPGGAPGTWIATYDWEETRAMTVPGIDGVRAFLTECMSRRIVCGNIKRSNFRVRGDGGLCYIDIGNWIVPMDVSILRDSAARLYSIGVLGWSDEELLRRPTDGSREEIWDRIPGFASFYGETVARFLTARRPVPPSRRTPARHPEVSLLIKACAMDSAHARDQIVHIVDQLVGPWDFAERILVIDPHPGPFVRQHADGDLCALHGAAADAARSGLLDRVVTAPSEALAVARLNLDWFGADCSSSRTVDGVPVAPQLWGFEQVRTRYVLQCDMDVLVGRRTREHDYLSEMLAAARRPGVVGVAFNIAKDPASAAVPYDSPPGEYKPEVRCGLLDLERLRACRPLPNSVEGERLGTTWYRSLHALQRRQGFRTLRGGDPSAFYVHPPNTRKADGAALARIRDLVSQGLVPAAQWNRWDLEAPGAEWSYPRRGEAVVVLARGRNTGRDRLERFAAGLRMQDEQSFGVIVIDDASDDVPPSVPLGVLSSLGSRLTLIRNGVRRGRAENTDMALRTICSDPDTLVVVVDLDDTLADPGALRRLREIRCAGHDVVLAAPFRPDAPTRVYHPDLRAPRDTWGGDVWIHLRAFTKALFDRLPPDAMKLDGEWVTQCDDYALMVPIVEMARSPVYVPEYLYWHERRTQKGEAEQLVRDQVIRRLLSKPSPSRTDGRG